MWCIVGFFFFVWLPIIFCQNEIILTSGVTQEGVILPGEIINFTIQGIPNSNMRIELAGEINEQFLSIEPPEILQAYNSNGNSEIGSVGTDINGEHTTGSLCPNLVTDMTYIYRLRTTSDEGHSYSVRVTLFDTDISESLQYSSSLCCLGSEYLASDYIIYRPEDGVSSITIMGERTSDRLTGGSEAGPDFLIRRNDCPTAPTVEPTTDYRFLLPDQGPFSITIDENSDPPFQPGGIYYFAPRRAAFGTVGSIEDISFVVCPNGVCQNVETASSSSDSNSFSVLCLNAIVFAQFLFVLFF